MVEVAASYFLKNELPIFECYANRTPHVEARGWPDLEWWMVDADAAPNWKCYAVPVPSSYIVIDVDLRKPEAYGSFERLSSILDVSGAFTCATARGGFHYWLKNPMGQKIRKTLKEYPGIDFLSEGAYVIGPGSVAETGTYTYKSGDLQTCPDVSAALLAALDKTVTLDSENLVVPGTSVTHSLEQERYKQWLLNQPGAVAGENGDDYTYNMAAYAVDFGITQAEALDVLAVWNQTCTPPWSMDELTQKVQRAYRYAQNALGKIATNFDAFTATKEALAASDEAKLDETFDQLHPGVGLTFKGDRVANTATNLRLILLFEQYKGLFLWDRFRQKIVLDRIPSWRGDSTDISLEMSPMDWRELRIELSIQHRIDVSEQLLEDGVYGIARIRSFHPICDWLSSLHWDGIPRLGRIFGDADYQRTIIKIFLLGSIYRIFYPGYKFDHMLVIAGRQGLGKSMLVQMLGGEWARTLQHMPLNHRGLQEMQGGWWIELPELSAIKKADINQIKAFITTPIDTFIPLHGRHGPIDHPRICVPVWTLNPLHTGFIVDEENRRFLIIEQKEHLDLQFIKINRDQIFAEAMELYRAGVKPHELVQTIAGRAEEIAQQRRVDESDVWEDLIAEWIVRTKQTKITTLGIYQEVLGAYREIDYDKKSQMRIGNCLRRLGWKRTRGCGVNYYVKNDDETLAPNDDAWDIEV